MEDKMIYVPYKDFVDGVAAQTDLNSIRRTLSSGVGYCSDDIMAILGIPIEKGGEVDA